MSNWNVDGELKVGTSSGDPTDTDKAQLEAFGKTTNGGVVTIDDHIADANKMVESTANRFTSRKLLVALVCLAIGGGLTYVMRDKPVALGSLYTFLTAMYSAYALANVKAAQGPITQLAAKAASMLPK